MSGNLIIDEIPKSLIPLYCLGESLGVETTTIKTVIDLACQVCNVDFWAIGRTLANIGLAGLTAEEMVQYANTCDLFDVQSLHS
jgi:opine dehydrogenase